MKTTLLLSALLFGTFSQAQDETVKKLQSEASQTIAKDAADTVQKSGRKAAFIISTWHRDH